MRFAEDFTRRLRPGTEKVGERDLPRAGPDRRSRRRRPIRSVDALARRGGRALPRKLLFFLPSGKEAREVTFTKFRKVQGKTVVAEMEIRDLLGPAGAGGHAPRVPRHPAGEDRRRDLHARRRAGDVTSARGAVSRPDREPRRCAVPGEAAPRARPQCRVEHQAAERRRSSRSAAESPLPGRRVEPRDVARRRSRRRSRARASRPRGSRRRARRPGPRRRTGR